MNLLTDYFLFLMALFHNPSVDVVEKKESKDSAFTSAYINIKNTIAEDCSLHCSRCQPVLDKGKDTFTFSISGYRRATKQEARHLLVQAMETIVGTINTSEELRPYLACHPIKEDAIELTLECLNPLSNCYNDGSVERATCKNRRVYFFTKSLQSPLPNLESTELWQQTTAIVASCPLGYCLKEHHGASYEAALDHYYEALTPFMHWLSGVHFGGFGACVSDTVTKLQFRFYKKGNISLQKARSILIQLFDSYADKIEQNTLLQSYIDPQKDIPHFIDVELMLEPQEGEGLSKVLYSNGSLYYYCKELGKEHLIHAEDMDIAKTKKTQNLF